MAASTRPAETGPWDAALEQLREWDSRWAESCFEMSTNPWAGGVLSRKFIELVSLGLNAACTNLNPDGTRRFFWRKRRQRAGSRFQNLPPRRLPVTR